jgi:hypothetical protein
MQWNTKWWHKILTFVIDASFFTFYIKMMPKISALQYTHDSSSTSHLQKLLWLLSFGQTSLEDDFGCSIVGASTLASVILQFAVVASSVLHELGNSMHPVGVVHVKVYTQLGFVVLAHGF